MKYLRAYEQMLKSTNNIAINNPMNDFSMRILKLLKETSLSEYTISRYFFGNGDISIICKLDYNFKVLRIKFSISDSNVIMVIEKNNKRHNKHRTNIKLQTMDDIFNFIKDKLTNYIQRILSVGLLGDKISYLFSINELDTVIRKIEKYYLKVNLERYNI